MGSIHHSGILTLTCCFWPKHQSKIHQRISLELFFKGESTITDRGLTFERETMFFCIETHLQEAFLVRDYIFDQPVEDGRSVWGQT